MKLKSFGCSFVYGSDLKDCPHGVDDNNPPPSTLSWPALLAKKYDLEYQCYARPGAGNLQILETLLSTDFTSEKSLHVINWTWIDRFNYTSDKAKSGTHPWNPIGWCSILPCGNDPISKIYYQQIHSQFRDKLETLICIKTAIDTLTQNKQQFLMTYTDELIWETQWHISPAIENLQRSVCSHVIGFADKGFIEWAKFKKFKISDKGHPLEDAHQAATDLMIPRIDAILRRA